MTRLSAAVATKTSFLNSSAQPHIPCGATAEENIRMARAYIARGSKHVLIRTYSEEEDSLVQAFIAEAEKSHPGVRVQKHRHSHSY